MTHGDFQIFFGQHFFIFFEKNKKNPVSSLGKDFSQNRE
jgi:hypothetical protein